MNIRVGELSGSDATNALHDTLKRLTEQSQAQTKQMLALTWTIAVLTAVMLAAVLVQIYLVVKPPRTERGERPSASSGQHVPELTSGETYRYLGDGRFQRERVVDWKDLK